MQMVLKLLETFLFLSPQTVQMYGQIKTSSSWMKTDTLQLLPVFHRIISVPPDSFGAILSMPGMNTKKRIIPGGFKESVISSL